jgi:hypothetical protein
MKKLNAGHNCAAIIGASLVLIERQHGRKRRDGATTRSGGMAPTAVGMLLLA